MKIINGDQKTFCLKNVKENLGTNGDNQESNSWKIKAHFLTWGPKFPLKWEAPKNPPIKVIK